MNSAKLFEIERLAKEYAAWRAVSEDDRAPAAAWWWSTVLALRDETAVLPDHLHGDFGLPAGSSYADLAARLLEDIAVQKRLASPSGFPMKPKSKGSSKTDRA